MLVTFNKVALYFPQRVPAVSILEMAFKLLLPAFCTIKRAVVCFVEVDELIVVGKGRIVIANRNCGPIMNKMKVNGTFDIACEVIEERSSHLQCVDCLVFLTGICRLGIGNN